MGRDRMSWRLRQPEEEKKSKRKRKQKRERERGGGRKDGIDGGEEVFPTWDLHRGSTTNTHTSIYTYVHTYVHTYMYASWPFHNTSGLFSFKREPDFLLPAVPTVRASFASSNFFSYVQRRNAGVAGEHKSLNLVRCFLHRAARCSADPLSGSSWRTSANFTSTVRAIFWYASTQNCKGNLKARGRIRRERIISNF